MPRLPPKGSNAAPAGRPKPEMGGRPYFFDDPAIDQIMAVVLAMSAELSVVYDRVDTIERLLAGRDLLDRGEVEAYRPDDQVAKERRARHKDYLDRIFRIIREERQGLVPHDNMSDYDQVISEVAKGPVMA
jgi:hypothetical protein